MTICIAAIISDDTVALAADKMTTVRAPNIEFERKSSKIMMARPFCGVATAGDALIHAEIFKRAANSLSSASTVEESANALATAFAAERERLAEDNVLRPIGLTFQFLRTSQQNLRPEVILQLYQSLGTWRFDFVMIVAGVDATGPHIYQIMPPGSSRSFDALGYLAIGSGEQHALQTFVTSDFDRPLSKVRALLTTYEAKKRAERATGVGTSTDVFLVSATGHKQLTAAELAELDKHYKDKLTEERSWLERFEKAGLSFI